MFDLLNEISKLGTINFLIIMVVVALAIKEGISLVKFFKEYLKEKFFDKKNNENLYNEIQKINTSINEIKKQQQKNQECIDILMQSDIDDIRSWIVSQYNYYKNPDTILDDYMMDCIEKRFACYEKEGGNSYVHTLVAELRKFHMR